MNNHIKGKKRHKCRAVAPIIATLILVAIAVVGGVMIFTFSQGFFGEQAVTTVPKAEILTMVGYDARNHATNDLTWHNGDNTGFMSSTTLDTNAAVKGGADSIIIYIRNGGDNDVTISNVQALGNGAGTPSTGCSSAVSGDIFCALTSATITQNSIEGILFATGDETVTNGRTFTVKVTTSNDNVFKFNLVAGKGSGGISAGGNGGGDDDDDD